MWNNQRFSHLPGHTEQPASGQNNPNVTQEYDQLSGPYDTVDQWLAQEEELLDEPNLTSIQPHPLLYIQSQPIQPAYNLSESTNQNPQTPSVKGITLCPTSEIPNPYRSLFPFGLFNAVQSASLEIAYHRDDNLVVSAPTGSGKTVIMELAMLRTILSSRTEVKIIYMAPTKSLCSERTKDWTNKFSQFGITCRIYTSNIDRSFELNIFL
ncbi:P-loop containing nucleoside triphosphate hydrolase protein [Phycomyces blakesleeanus]|uniref:P-loop containing nucleoside triphosphate hydrolase protein n=1 Tax=Phycomyces blakesleeanus TaxID=4837 RepID=A0ABR3AYG6_PHYBL